MTLRPYQRLKGNNQLPSGAALRVDWSHPMANGLIGCWVPGISGGIDLTGKGEPLTISPTQVLGLSYEGPVAAENNTDNYCYRGIAHPDLYIWPNGEFSMYARGYMSTNCTANFAGICSIMFDTLGSTSPFFIAEMGSVSGSLTSANGGVFGLKFNDNGGLNQSNFVDGWGPTFSPSQAPCVYSCGFALKTGGTQYLYRGEGGQPVSVSGLADQYTASSQTISTGPTHGTNPGIFLSRINGVAPIVVYAFSRQLTKDDMIALDRDPFAFLVSDYEDELLGWTPNLSLSGYVPYDPWPQWSPLLAS